MALSNAERQARWREKHREINANNAVTVTENNAEVIAFRNAQPVACSAKSWRWQFVAVGLAIYLAAIANNVYSCWGLEPYPFAVTVVTAVIAESALLVTLPAAFRGRLLAVPLAVLVFGVVALNEFKVIALTTADQASARTAASVATLNAACPPAATTTTKRGNKTTTTTTAEGAGCTVAKANAPAARPDLEAFQRFAAWATPWRPSPEDFDNLRLLALVLFLNSGGFFLALARR